MYVNSTVQSASVLSRLGTVANARQNAAAAGFTPAKAAEPTEEPAQSTSAKSETAELLQKLNDYIEKGPIVAMREKILESMGISEDDLKAMSPEKQKAVEAEIAQRIKEMLLEQQEMARGQQGVTQKASMYSALSGLTG